MQILAPDFIYTPQGFMSGKAVAFTQTIEAIDTLKTLQKRYPDANIVKTKPHTVLYPGFINTHVHLEFSSNTTTLKYGSFMPWLHSVIEHREDLVSRCDNSLMRKACQEMLHSGITSFGAISSFGNELEVCEETPQRVVFFNELIGSNAMVADMLYSDFMDRVRASMSCEERSRITPAIAIHSPYSVHPILLQKAINVAKKHGLPLSAHLLESQAEREWLEHGSGEFKTFFEEYFNTSATPITTIKEFLYAFDTYPTHFTHVVQANTEELHHLASKGHSIAHCPRSNRYLGCGRLAIEDLELPFTTATDGLSSNDSLNIFDELRAALLLHNEIPIHTLAQTLIASVTSNAAEALHLDTGRIEQGKLADFALVTLPEAPQREEEIALWSILHTKKVDGVYIAGERQI